MTLSKQARAISYLFQRYLLRRKYLTAHLPNYGWQFRFKTADGGGRSMYKRGVYEPAQTHYLLDNLKVGKDDVLIDVGANLGWYSVLLSSIAPPTAQIFAFEPETHNFDLLCRNLDLNNASNVTPVQKALSTEPGKLTMYLYPDKNTGRHSLLPLNSSETVEVETTTLDLFLAERKIDPARVKFLKIDVEGYEEQVLRGGTSLLAHQPVILSEYSPNSLREVNQNVTGIFDLMNEFGYCGAEIEGGKLAPVHIPELVDLERYTDIWWQSAEKAVAAA